MYVTITPARGSVVRHLDPLRMLSNIWRNRHLVVQLTAQEVLQRYRGSYLGMAWSLVVPILMLVVYAFVFSIVFQARWAGRPGRPGSASSPSPCSRG